MYPIHNESRTTKRKWLGRDYQQAVINFNLHWDELEGKQKVKINTEIEQAINPYAHNDTQTKLLEEMVKNKQLPIIPLKIKGLDTTKLKYKTKVRVDESIYFTWLRNKIMHKEFKDLAEGTGYSNLIRLDEIINHMQDIPLSQLYHNYINSIQFKNIQDDDEKKKTIAAWNIFIKLIDKETLEQITLQDVLKYESYLQSQNLSDKTKNHYKNRVSKIFRLNLKKFEDTTKIQKVLGYFSKWEKLEINSSSSIAAQMVSVNDFNKLYNHASIEMKALLMFCLNTGTYIKEAARIKLSEINLKEHTLMTKRNKTGQCRKIAYLWNRTIKAIKDYIDMRKNKTDLLFVARHGGAYDKGQGLRTKFYELRKKTDLLHIDFSHLRDTFETVGKEVGLSNYHIDLVMGHSSGGTGDRYTHRRIHNELKKACLAVEKDYFGENKTS